MKTFRLAPMTLDLLIMTLVVLALPLALAMPGAGAPRPVRDVLLGSAGFMAVLYLTVWFWWRPSRFEITERGLTIVWPLRSLVVSPGHMDGVSIVDRKEFRRLYGWGMRVGAGGLWGGFGLLVTGKETFAMYISRTDRFVILRRKGGRALMITPEDPERFVDALREIPAPLGGLRV